ncbi:hypothetical protein GJAV_G00087220 [Gymnothorax javanicus]|nr:hypothetical protein GJAV_G00087220 [Gymnothorax javanicus]
MTGKELLSCGFKFFCRWLFLLSVFTPLVSPPSLWQASPVPGMAFKYSSAQLLKLNTHTRPACVSTIRELGLMRRPRYIHRRSRRKFIYYFPQSNHSAPTVPAVWSTTGARCTHHQSTVALDARSTGRGGGLAAIHRQDLELSTIPVPVLSSFECLAFKGKPPLSLTFLLIYRLPKSNPSFIPEFQDLLGTLCTSSANVLVLGDLNIHVDMPSCHSAAEILHQLDCLNLQQHIDAPTHSRGHTLDLVITNSVPIVNLQVRDLGLSDHKAVFMELPLSHSPSSISKHQIHFRATKNIDSDAFTLDLGHVSSGCTALSSVTETVDYYNQSLTSLLDHHAPVKTRTVTFLRSALWYNSALRRMKSAERILERRFKASGLTVHKQAYREHQKAYAKALKDTRSQFFSKLINNNPANSKQLFSTISHLLKPHTSSHLDATVEKQLGESLLRRIDVLCNWVQLDVLLCISEPPIVEECFYQNKLRYLASARTLRIGHRTTGPAR